MRDMFASAYAPTCFLLLADANYSSQLQLHSGIPSHFYSVHFHSPPPLAVAWRFCF